MPSKSPAQRLRDIVDNIDAIGTFTGEFDLAAFTADRKTVYAVVRALEIVSEASRRLPAEFKNRLPEINWSAIAASALALRAAPLKILGLKAGLFRDFRQYGGAKLFGIVEREWVVRPPVLFHDSVGAHRPGMPPPTTFQGGEHTARLRRRPGSHAAISNTAFAESGGNSPCATRSRTISRAAD